MLNKITLLILSNLLTPFGHHCVNFVSRVKMLQSNCTRNDNNTCDRVQQISHSFIWITHAI